LGCELATGLHPDPLREAVALSSPQAVIRGGREGRGWKGLGIGRGEREGREGCERVGRDGKAEGR